MLDKLSTDAATRWYHHEQDHPGSRRFARQALAVLAGLAAFGRPITVGASDPCSPKGSMCDENECCPEGYEETTEWCPGGTGCWDGAGGESCCDCMEIGYNDLEHLCWCSEGEGGGPPI